MNWICRDFNAASDVLVLRGHLCLLEIGVLASLHVAIALDHSSIAIHLGALCDDGTLAFAIRDRAHVLLIDARGEATVLLAVVRRLFVQAGAIHRGGCGCGVKRRAD